MKFSLVIFISLCVQVLFGQNDRLVSKVFLRNNSVYIGYLTQKSPEYYTLELKDGSLIMQIPVSEIKKIVQYDPSSSYKAHKPYEFKERGFYNTTYLKLNSGYDINREPIIGYGLESVSGFMLNRYLGIGLGFGYDFLGTSSHNGFFPLFAEARGYLFGKQSSYYYSISAGYSFIGKPSELTITQSNGGPMFHPAIGVRFGGRKYFNTCLDFGVRIQSASWLSEPQNSWLKSERVDYSYKRFVIRLGIQI